MADLAALAAIVVAFAGFVGLVRVCDRIVQSPGYGDSPTQANAETDGAA